MFMKQGENLKTYHLTIAGRANRLYVQSVTVS